MEVRSTDAGVAELSADAVVIGLYCDEPPSGAASVVDEATGGLISRLVEGKEIDTSVMSVTPLLGVTSVAAGQVLCLGLGSRSKFNEGAAFRSAAAASRHLAKKPRQRVGFFLDDAASSGIIESAIAGAVVGCEGQDLYRRKKEVHPIEQLLWRPRKTTSVLVRRSVVASI